MTSGSSSFLFEIREPVDVPVGSASYYEVMEFDPRYFPKVFKGTDLMIRVLIVDDSPHIRDSLTTLIAAQPDLAVVGAACDGLEAVDMASELDPQVVVMDAQMPNLDGIGATQCIKKSLPHVGVLFLSVFTDYLEASIAVGADGYLTKDCELDDLLAEIRRIASDVGVRC